MHISVIEDDYYVYDERHHCLFGERTRKIYRLGDSVRIKVVSASIANRTIDFVLVEFTDDEKGMSIHWLRPEMLSRVCLRAGIRLPSPPPSFFKIKSC